MASWSLIDHSLLLHFVLLTDAAAVIVLYCKFSKKKSEHIRPSEHPDGIIGCKDKRAPMVVTLGQQYHVGACFSVVQFIF